MARDYVQALKQLLPRGKFWEIFPDSVKEKLLTAIAVELGRVDARAENLLDEMDPRTTTELIEDWERVAGLPDPCTDAPTAIADRRHALTGRIIARGGWSGGPSVPFFESLIEALGYDADHILIRRFHLDPFTCGSECDDFLYSDDEGWACVWEFIVKHGELDDVLRCQVAKYILVHLGVTFAFPLFFFEDGSFSRAGSGVFTDPVTGVQTNLAANELGTVYVGV